MRAFIALGIPDDMRGRIAQTMTLLRPTMPGLRWLSPSTVHITLRFLGDVTPTQVERLREPLAAAAYVCSPTEVTLTGLGTFPERGSPRVLWLGSELPEPLLALQRSCEDAAVQCGAEAETKPFRSHLTLGRWRERVRRPELPPVDLGAMMLSAVVLYESRLDTRGAIHTPLATFSFCG